MPDQDPTRSSNDLRRLVRQIARKYLQEQAPESLEKLDVVFDAAFTELEEAHWGRSDPAHEDSREVGLPIDAAFLDGTIVTSVLWITANLVREAFRYRDNPDVSERLSRLEEMLAEKTGEEDRVHELLVGVEAAMRVAGNEGFPPTVARAMTTSELHSPESDLQLFVNRGHRDGKLTLHYRLNSAMVGLFYKDFGSKEIELDPLVYFRDLLDKIEEQPLKTRADREWAEKYLRSRGAKLFASLLPESLQEMLWELLDSGGRVQTLQIVSEEPWIPWELVRFQGRRGDPEASGPFWGEAFVVTRGLSGKRPAGALPLSKMAMVVAEGAGLPEAKKEREFLLSLSQVGRTVKEIPARPIEVVEALASGRYDGWHFICHAETDETDADCSALRLKGYDDLTPDDLQGEASKLGRASPLVFLNACQAGRGGLSLTGIGGWAAGFLGAGAGAFLGPLWSIRDSRARAFAKAFYRAFVAGKTLGEAVYAARLELRKSFPGDPSWLAYAVFGIADARVQASSSVEPTSRRHTKESKRDTKQSASPLEEAPVVIETRSPERPRSRKSEPGAERINEKDGMELVYVPSAVYTLGADDLTESCRPIHQVRLSAFWIGKYPVTNEQYAGFLRENPDHRKPSFWDDESFNQPQQPVVGVSRADAEAYCEWAGLQLPTEAQWEAAARGPDGRPYPWGNIAPNNELCNFGWNIGKPTLVDAYASGRGPFGTFDQAGNVWEWCLDAWSLIAYKERVSGETDPFVEGDTSYCAVRGGSWINPSQDLRAAFREGSTASMRPKHQGFRCSLLTRQESA